MTYKGFYKSVTVKHDGELWHGVHLPNVTGKGLHLKFTKDTRSIFLLIGFEGSGS